MPGSPTPAHQAFPAQLAGIEQRLAQLEVWVRMLATQPASWQTPALEHSWVNYGEGWLAARYVKDALGFVHLAGLIKSGEVNKSAFILPAGYRPTEKLLFGTVSKEAVGEVEVDSVGGVTPISPSTNAWVSLNGITFLAEQ